MGTGEKYRALKINLFVLSIFQVLSISQAFDTSCPSQAQWDLRAKSMCFPAKNYACLYNVTFRVNVYREKCSSRPRLLDSGYKYVFQPNPNRAICRETRYQPFIFDTNGYSDCAFLKSACNSKGQTTYDNGNSTSDRTCICNTTQGYSLVVNSNNSCYCNPSTEDCSCYLAIYPTNKTSGFKDLKCLDEVNITLKQTGRDPLMKSKTLKIFYFDDFKYNIASPSNTNRTVAGIVTIIVALYIIVAVGVYFRQNILHLFINHQRKYDIMNTLPKRINNSTEQNEEFIFDDQVTSNECGKEEEINLKEGESSTRRVMHKIEVLDLENQDHVPNNIRAQMRLKIRDWEEDSNMFIRTRAYEKILGKIGSQSCVAVTGSSGSGKSAIVRQASLLLCKERYYSMIMISTPIELKTYYSPGKKILFVLEDVCGKFTANEEQIYGWDLMKDVVDQVIKDGACKILFSCRLQVYNDPKFSLLQSFKCCECNIISDDLCLTIDEKKSIFKSYLGSETINDDIFSKPNANFPLLCQQYSIRTEDHPIDKYFETPYGAYKTELEILKVHAKTKICGLCLCIMFNNQLEEKYFQILSPKFKTVVKDTCEFIGLPKATAATCIREELDTLDKTYINKHEGVYKICHDNLFDFMAYYFGNMIPQCFINHAESGFLRERFLCKTAFNPQSDECSIQNIVYLEDHFQPSYIKRMISDWTIGKVSDVFYNINMKSSSFRKEFLKCLEGIVGKEATHLANMKDLYRDDFASGNTPVIISCLHGFNDLLKWLIDNKTNVNVQRADGASALCMACEKNNVDAVNILLENNADVNLCTNEGASPLCSACFFNGNLEIITGLLKTTSDVNKHKLNINNMTPLYMACRRNFLPAVSELLKHNADPRICLHNGMSPLLIACRKRNTDIVSMLLQNSADPNVVKIDGTSPLFMASGMGFKAIVQLLLANGADTKKCVNSKEQLTIASEGKQNSLAGMKKSWLRIMRKVASPETLEYVSRTKPSDNIFDIIDIIAGSSPLHVACFMGHTEISKLLSNSLECVDLRKDNGITPLFYACAIGHLDIIHILLEKGADPNICKGNQCSPLAIARLNNHDEVLKLLRTYTS